MHDTFEMRSKERRRPGRQLRNPGFSQPAGGVTRQEVRQLVDDGIRIGVFVCDCGLNIAGTVDTEEVRKYAEKLPHVIVAVRNRYTCSDPGQQEVKKSILENKINRVVVASCTPRLHESTFRTCISEAGLNPYLLDMASLREHCSWVHLRDHQAA